MDSHSNHTDLVTGRTYSSPAAPASYNTYSQSQIIPYSQPRVDMMMPTRYGSNKPPAKSKSTNSSSSSSWPAFDDPEIKRRRRVASYKAYAVEGRVKSSLRKGVRWFKNKYLEMRYGWW